MKKPARQVVTKTDLKNALGMKGVWGDCVAGLAYGFCGLGEINRLFDGAADYQGREFADHLLENMNITIDVNPDQLANIPKQGGFIVVSNHPLRRHHTGNARLRDWHRVAACCERCYIHLSVQFYLKP